MCGIISSWLFIGVLSEQVRVVYALLFQNARFLNIGPERDWGLITLIFMLTNEVDDLLTVFILNTIPQ